jgi:hypothetical protein
MSSAIHTSLKIRHILKTGLSPNDPGPKSLEPQSRNPKSGVQSRAPLTRPAGRLSPGDGRSPCLGADADELPPIGSGNLSPATMRTKADSQALRRQLVRPHLLSVTPPQPSATTADDRRPSSRPLVPRRRWLVLLRPDAADPNSAPARPDRTLPTPSPSTSTPTIAIMSQSAPPSVRVKEL